MSVLIMCIALYGCFTLAYQVTGVVIDAVSLARKMDRAAQSLTSHPRPAEATAALRLIKGDAA